MWNFNNGACLHEFQTLRHEITQLIYVARSVNSVAGVGWDNKLIRWADPGAPKVMCYYKHKPIPMLDFLILLAPNHTQQTSLLVQTVGGDLPIEIHCARPGTATAERPPSYAESARSTPSSPRALRLTGNSDRADSTSPRSPRTGRSSSPVNGAGAHASSSGGTLKSALRNSGPLPSKHVVISDGTQSPKASKALIAQTGPPNINANHADILCMTANEVMLATGTTSSGQIRV